MGMTIIEKILARKAGLDTLQVRRLVVVDVDMTVLIDLQFATMWLPPNRIHDPDKLAVIMDHAVPAPDDQRRRGRRPGPASSPPTSASSGSSTSGDTASATKSSPRTASPVPARSWPAPTRTPAPAGAYNTAARGLGPAEVYSIMCTGTTWFQVAPDDPLRARRAQARRVSGKDIFLHIAARPTATPPTPTSSSAARAGRMPMNDRRTIATQGAEVSADFSTFDADEVLREFLAGLGVDRLRRSRPRPDAAYLEVRRVDLSALEPYVARAGHGQPQRRSRSREIEPADGRPGFIGSCANGQLEDLRIAADVLRGSTVAPGVRLIVTPASQAVYREAMRRATCRTSPTPGGRHQLDLRRLLRLPHGRGRAGRGLPDRRAPATSPAGWAAPRPRSTWPRRPPWRPRRSPAHHRSQERDRMTIDVHRAGCGCSATTSTPTPCTPASR